MNLTFKKKWIYIYNGIDGVLSVTTDNKDNGIKHCVYKYYDFFNSIAVFKNLKFKHSEKYKKLDEFLQTYNINDYKYIYVYDKKNFLKLIDIEKLNVSKDIDIIDVRMIPSNVDIYIVNKLIINVNRNNIFNTIKSIQEYLTNILNNKNHVLTTHQNLFYNSIVIPSVYSMEKNYFRNADMENNPLYKSSIVNANYKIFDRHRLFSNYINEDKLIQSKYKEAGTLYEIDIHTTVLQYFAKILLNDFVFGTNPIYYLQHYIPFLNNKSKIDIKKFYNNLVFNPDVLNISDLDIKIKNNSFINLLLFTKKEILLKYKSKGYLISPISGIKIKHKINETNYMSVLYQVIETEMNMLIIDKYNKLISENNLLSKSQKEFNNIIMYKYDSFIFDFSEEEMTNNSAVIKLGLFQYILKDELNLLYDIKSTKNLYKNFKK